MIRVPLPLLVASMRVAECGIRRGSEHVRNSMWGVLRVLIALRHHKEGVLGQIAADLRSYVLAARVMQSLGCIEEGRAV